MAYTNMEFRSMSDRSIIAYIGSYLKHHRLTKNQTQEKVAIKAGINRWTLSKIENGEPISMLSLIQILRSLDLLYVLDAFEVHTQLSPLQIAKMDKERRLRASSEREAGNNQIDSYEW